MAVRVDLRKWGKKNLHYISAWLGMGITLFSLLTWKLGIWILVLIGPFIPYLAITLARLTREVKK